VTVSQLGPQDELIALPSEALAALVSPQEAALLGHAFHGATLAALRDSYLGARGAAGAAVEVGQRWRGRREKPAGTHMP
jgi:hypothetical protein